MIFLDPIAPWGKSYPLPCLNYIRSTDQVTFRSFSSKTQKVGARISLGDVDDDPEKKNKGQAVEAMWSNQYLFNARIIPLACRVLWGIVHFRYNPLSYTTNYLLTFNRVKESRYLWYCSYLLLNVSYSIVHRNGSMSQILGNNSRLSPFSIPLSSYSPTK